MKTLHFLFLHQYFTLLILGIYIVLFNNVNMILYNLRYWWFNSIAIIFVLILLIILNYKSQYTKNII